MRAVLLTILLLTASEAGATLPRQTGDAQVVLSAADKAQLQVKCMDSLKDVPARQAVNTCQCLQEGIQIYMPRLNQRGLPDIDWKDVNEMANTVRSSGRFLYFPELHISAQKLNPVMAEIVEMCATEGILLK